MTTVSRNVSEYRIPEESFYDHSEFLRSVQDTVICSCLTEQITGVGHSVEKAGYATNPQYAELLIDLIEKQPAPVRYVSSGPCSRP